MAIRLTTTAQAAVDSGIKILVHGPAGSGKTSLCGTSLRHLDIPVIEVKSFEDIYEAYRFVVESADAAHFRWVCLDSISEIAEVCLAAEKAKTRDPRQAYGALADEMNGLIRSFRDLPGRNVYFSCKQQREQDSTGATMFVPSLPGAKLGQGISYFFDEVFALRVERDQDGKPVRWLQTGRDYTHEGKDRSGALELFEPPHLGAIARKILASVHQQN